MVYDDRGQWDMKPEPPRHDGNRGWYRNRGGSRGQRRGDSRHGPLSGAYGPMDRGRMQQIEATRQIHQSLFHLGSDEGFQSAVEIPKVCAWLETQALEFPVAVLSAFRIMATEQPQKTALTAAMIAHLVLKPGAHSTESGKASLGMRVMEHLIHMFGQDVDAHYWRNARLVLHVFVALAPLGVVSSASLRRTIKAFVDVLSSDGVSRDVADPAADCVIEAMCRGGTDLIQPEPGALEALPSAREEMDAIVDGITLYGSQRSNAAMQLISPFRLDEPHDFLDQDGFMDRVRALQSLKEHGYVRPAFLPSACDLLSVDVSPATSTAPAEQRTAHLPDLHVAPIRSTAYDELDDDLLAPPKRLQTGKGTHETVRVRTGAPSLDAAARWFGSSVPAIGSVEGVVLRGIVQDIIDLYVINRKECAHVLLTLPQWLRRGTFGGKIPPHIGIFGDEPEPEVSVEWMLEDVLLEGALSTMLLLPRPPQLELYYSSLMREIVTLAPQQIAPSIGRTIRRFYVASADGVVRAEVLRRVADWFSVHLSNFKFTWAWNEWADDMTRAWAHPRPALARRIVELEVRLAYYDRIKGTLPPDMEAYILPPFEPSPNFVYNRPSHSYHGMAEQLFQSIKAKASVHVVQADLQSFQQSILAPATDVPDADDTHHVDSPAEAERVARDVGIQTLLFAGSRSFSHLLNVIERYHELLRALSQSPEARVSILHSTCVFWTHSPQWFLIVCDKLLQYRIVEPLDVVTFVFSEPSGDAVMEEASPFDVALHAPEWGNRTHRDWSSFHWWAVLRLTMDKVIGRVNQLSRRVQDLRRVQAAPEAAASDTAQRHAPATLDEAQVHLDAVQLEQRKVLVTILSKLVSHIQEHGGNTSLSDETDSSGWQSWWVREWYHAFVAVYYDVIAANRETILANVFASAGTDDTCAVLFEQACALAQTA